MARAYLIAFLIGLTFCSPAFAVSPIGSIEGIDSNGVIYGWAQDPDAPNASIDVHIYKDGQAGVGGTLIGATKAGTAHATGAHGFRFPLSPVAWDGAPHSYYVYGIDATNDSNVQISNSPKIATFNSTIVRISNGMTTVGIEPRCGGAIVEVIYNNVNMVNNYDCTGRQVQTALYDGNGAYDNCAACTGTWGWNPVQGGDKWGFGSVLLDYAYTNSSLYIKTRPYEWYPDDKGGGAGSPILSDVMVEQWISFVAGQLNAIKVRVRVVHLGVDSHSLTTHEMPAVYVNLGFDRFMRYAGVSPWTNSALTESTVQSGRYYSMAENWGAFVNAQGDGLMVYTPSQYPWGFGFRLVDPDGVQGPFGNSTNYFAPFMPFALAPLRIVDGGFYIIAGNYQQSRQTVYSLKASVPTVDYLPPYGYLDSPISGEKLKGYVSISGWALDNVKVTKVEILINGAVAGSATLNRSRPDIPGVFPNASPTSGYAFTLDTRKYADGNYAIVARARDAAGNVSNLFNSANVRFANKR